MPGLFLIGEKEFSREYKLSTSDDHHARRAIQALSHGKPKPYRRQLVSDEPYRLSRLQVGLLITGATLIGGLILTVAVIAQEHANATRGKVIVAAPYLAPRAAPPAPGSGRVPEAALPAPVAHVPVALTPPILDDTSMPLPDPQSPPLQLPRPKVVKAPARPAPAPKLLTKRTPTRPPVQPAELLVRSALADPDVDLIATILQLTPQAPAADKASSVCTLESKRSDCGQAPGSRP